MQKPEKSSPKRGMMDAWVRQHLGVRMPSQARSAVLHEFNFTDMFGKSDIGKLKKDAGRGLFSSNLGSFKDVIGRAEDTAKAYAAFRADAKLSRGLLSRSTKVTPDELVQRFDSLIEEAQKWLSAFDEDGKREKLGKVSDKTEAPDKRRLLKMQACRDMIAGANICKAQLRRDALAANDDGVLRRIALVEALRLDIAKGKDKPGEVDQCRRLDAGLLQDLCGTKPAGGGTSEVGLIMAPEGGVAYAFKSVDGEAPSMGMPKGAGAIREVVVSRMCEALKNGPSQLDFGWPGACLAQLKGTDDRVKSGVIVEGLNGRKIYDADALSGISDREELVAKKQQSDELLKSLPALEIQKLAMCNLAFAQFDIKWDNAIVEDTDDGPKVRPYDGGAAMPSEDAFMDIALFRPGAKGLDLLKDSDGHELPQANQPLDPGLKRMFSAIDTNALATTAVDTMNELARSGLDPRALHATDGLHLTLAAIRGIQALLAADKTDSMTLKEFINACESQVFQPIAKKKEKDWLQAKVDAYIQLQARHTDLLPDVKKVGSAHDVFLNFMKADQRAALDRILAVGGAAVLKAHGLACPINFTPKNSFNALEKKLTKEDKARFPEVFKV